MLLNVAADGRSEQHRCGRSYSLLCAFLLNTVFKGYIPFTVITKLLSVIPVLYVLELFYTQWFVSPLPTPILPLPSVTTSLPPVSVSLLLLCFIH